jgi:SAM-dependent methyltransferase
MNSSPREDDAARSDVRLFTGDSLAILPTFEDASFDAIVTDPPYELDLMNLKWDASGIAYSVELWRECLRVLKPGGHLLAFGAPRTYHRMASAIEDAGFEIRDSIHWIYSNGFPKGTDVSKAIDRRRYDREAVLCLTRFVREARQRSGRTNAEIDALLGTRGMAQHFTSQSQPAVPRLEQWDKLKSLLGFGDEMDAEVERLCERKGKLGEAWDLRAITGHHDEAAPANQWSARYDSGKAATSAKERRDEPATETSREWKGWGTVLKPAHEPIVVARKRLIGSVANNVLQFRTGALNLDACRVPSTSNDRCQGRLPANVIFDEDAAIELDATVGSRKSGERKAGVLRANRGGYSGPTTTMPSPVCYGDEGGASRFFYVAKASPAERRAGLGDSAARHPTIKPVTLMRYLVRLVTPPGGVVLDPFTGSGSTGIAAVLEGKRFIGVEREPEYVAIADARINHWKGEKLDERRAA